jgi:hypothetical protein
MLARSANASVRRLVAWNACDVLILLVSESSFATVIPVQKMTLLRVIRGSRPARMRYDHGSVGVARRTATGVADEGQLVHPRFGVNTRKSSAHGERLSDEQLLHEARADLPIAIGGHADLKLGASAVSCWLLRFGTPLDSEYWYS